MEDTTVAFLLKEAMLAQAREEQAREKERKKVEAKERKRLKAAEEEEKMQALNARMLAGRATHCGGVAGVGTLEPTSSPALLVVLFWVEEEEKEEEEEEDETYESKAVDVLWVPV